EDRTGSPATPTTRYSRCRGSSFRSATVATILVSGAIANKLQNGGEAWVRLSWVLGLQRLGFDVYFVEQIAPETCVDQNGEPADFERSVNLTYFRAVIERFGLTGSASLVYGESEKTSGMTYDE